MLQIANYGRNEGCKSPLVRRDRTGSACPLLSIITLIFVICDSRLLLQIFLFFFSVHVLYSIICGSRLLVVTGYWIENTIQSRVAPGQKRKDILCVNREFRSRMYS